MKTNDIKKKAVNMMLNSSLEEYLLYLQRLALATK